MVGSVVAGAYLLLYPKLLRRHLERFSRKLYAEGENKGVLCWHELELYEDGFVERTPFNENKAAWGAIERIQSAPNYTFIYVGAANAHVIPHHRVLEGDLRSFLLELGNRFNADATLTRDDSPRNE